MFMEVSAIYRLLSVSLLRWLVTVYCNHGAAALTTTLHGTPRGRVEGLQRGITIMLYVVATLRHIVFSICIYDSIFSTKYYV